MTSQQSLVSLLHLLTLWREAWARLLLPPQGWKQCLEIPPLRFILMMQGTPISMGSLLCTHLMHAGYQSYAMERLLIQGLVLVVLRYTCFALNIYLDAMFLALTNLSLFILLLQITPAHDPNDFKLGKRHNLEFINIFTDDGKINTNGGADFTGMPRFAAREAIVEALKKQVLLDWFCLLV